MTPETIAHFKYVTKFERYRLLQKHPEKAEPGEIERLRKEFGFE